MASKTLVPVEEYLRMSFDGPDCEYVDGEILERNVGEYPHGKTQMWLGTIFGLLRRKYPLYASVDQRIRVAPGPRGSLQNRP